MTAIGPVQDSALVPATTDHSPWIATPHAADGGIAVSELQTIFLDPGDHCGPSGRKHGQAPACPAPWRGASGDPHAHGTDDGRQDTHLNWRSILVKSGEITRIRYEEVSTLPGDCRPRAPITLDLLVLEPLAGVCAAGRICQLAGRVQPLAGNTKQVLPGGSGRGSRVRRCVVRLTGLLLLVEDDPKAAAHGGLGAKEVTCCWPAGMMAPWPGPRSATTNGTGSTSP